MRIRSRALVMIMMVVGVMIYAGAGCRSDKLISEGKTDLGSAGNDLVTQRFGQYKGKRNHCIGGSGSNPKVIVTGFTKFGGVPYNLSGVVAASLLNGYWPSSFDAPVPLSLPAPAVSVMGDEEFGGKAQVRTVSIEGRSYDVCTLLLEVTWDLAAAIILHEAGRFEPDFIFMTGIDSSTENVATFERFTRNQSTRMGSYDSQGELRGDIASLGGPVLPVEVVVGRINMKWDGGQLAQETMPLFQYVRPSFSAQSREGDEPGSYVCNNVSFVVMNAIEGAEVRLTGGKIYRHRGPDTGTGRVGPQSLGLPDGALSAGAQAGFMHYPGNSGDTFGRSDAAYAAEVYGWAKIVAKVIRVTVP